MTAQVKSRDLQSLLNINLNCNFFFVLYMNVMIKCMCKFAEIDQPPTACPIRRDLLINNASHITCNNTH